MTKIFDGSVLLNGIDVCPECKSLMKFTKNAFGIPMHWCLECGYSKVIQKEKKLINHNIYI